MNSSHTISGTGAILPLLVQDTLNAVFELRMMIGLMVIIVLADLWWGLRELRHHREKALAEGDTLRAEQFRFRPSRAGRRTINKMVDYMTYLCVGAFLGLAITQPLGWMGYVTTAAIGLGLGCLFDIDSIIRHIMAIHGVHWNGRAALLALLRFKSREAAEVIEQSTETPDEKA